MNTSGCHPQMDGMVEEFNTTLISMLSKYVEEHGRDWDGMAPLYDVCFSSGCS